MSEEDIVGFGKKRPPRVYQDKKGSYYVKSEGKKIPLKVSGDITVEQLLNIVLKFIRHQDREKKSKTRRKEKKLRSSRSRISRSKQVKGIAAISAKKSEKGSVGSFDPEEIIRLYNDIKKAIGVLPESKTPSNPPRNPPRNPPINPPINPPSNPPSSFPYRYHTEDEDDRARLAAESIVRLSEKGLEDLEERKREIDKIQIPSQEDIKRLQDIKIEEEKKLEEEKKKSLAIQATIANIQKGREIEATRLAEERKKKTEMKSNRVERAKQTISDILFNARTVSTGPNSVQTAFKSYITGLDQVSNNEGTKAPIYRRKVANFIANSPEMGVIIDSLADAGADEKRFESSLKAIDYRSLIMRAKDAHLILREEKEMAEAEESKIPGEAETPIPEAPPEISEDEAKARRIAERLEREKAEHKSLPLVVSGSQQPQHIGFPFPIPVTILPPKPSEVPPAPEIGEQPSEEGIEGMGQKESKGKGLFDSEINKIMKPLDGWYKGTWSIDNFSNIPLSAQNIKNGFSTIINLDKAKGPGTHWIALNITPDSIEYYDSFGEEPPERFMEELKKLVDRIKTDVFLKMKINKIVDQRSNSDSCGWFAMKFLMDRHTGREFKDASGWSQVEKSEGKIKQFKKKFGYI